MLNRYDKMVKYWLYTVLFLCLAIVMLGGATRLTGSGLSITEWHPIHGIIPPLNQEQWNSEFLKYQQIAQYKDVNNGMSLSEFKGLYWWEWSHRLLARVIGLVSLLPLLGSFIVSLVKRGNDRVFKSWVGNKYFLYFLLTPFMVGIQGVIGWWMVYSGLANSKLTSVSQYRLATHMISASIIIMFVTYIARSLSEFKNPPAPRVLQKLACLLSVVILLQIYFGALVAGLHAGLSYNTWPLMDGSFIPSSLFTMKPIWHNFFENIATVQFVHRSFAYIVWIIALINLLVAKRVAPYTAHYSRSIILFGLVLSQAILGIIILLNRVPISLGLFHQFWALIILVLSVMHWRGTNA